MRYRYFAIRALDPESGAEALNLCLAAEPVLSVEHAFVADGTNSFWSVRVGLADEETAAADKRRRASGVDYRERLSAEHFANHYLAGADRWCLAQPGVRAHCRYMDDFLLWADDKAVLLGLRESFARYLDDELHLAIKPPLIQRSEHGVLYCGVRVKPWSLRPSARRRLRYRRAVAAWEERWRRGEIDALGLQRGYDAVRAILLPADDPRWRQRLHADGPRVDV